MSLNRALGLGPEQKLMNLGYLKLGSRSVGSDAYGPTLPWLTPQAGGVHDATEDEFHALSTATAAVKERGSEAHGGHFKGGEATLVKLQGSHKKQRTPQENQGKPRGKPKENLGEGGG